VTGPVLVDGAQPGDALKVTIQGFRPSGWGWSANIPGFGLLADQFTEPALHLWKYDPTTMAPAMYGPGGRVPLKPFTGTIGVAPAEPGLHSIVPPRQVGGNLDIRDLAAGTTLYLPVEVGESWAPAASTVSSSTVSPGATVSAGGLALSQPK
jgi:acetamidase/formamidase